MAHIEIVDLYTNIPIKNCDFHSKVLVYQKVSTKQGCMRMRIAIDTCSFFDSTITNRYKAEPGGVH